MAHDTRFAPPRERLAHVVSGREGRIRKARKIVELVGEKRFAAARRILEIGCGSGIIAATLAHLASSGTRVEAVDVVDSRTEKEGYVFQLVEGTRLPFEDGAVDLAVSNHVIEHVGDEVAQQRHLDEIGRLLAPAGVLYLAVPNRWRLVEPHYRLPLLSWLPLPLADAYVRITRRGTHYDCRPLSHGDAMRLFARTGFHAQDVTLEGLRATLRIEHHGSWAARSFASLPDSLLRLAMPIMPTYLFLATRDRV